MANEHLPIVLRILDNENRLGERADQKSISMLSILGVFMVFFIVNYRVLPINALTITMVTCYFFFAMLSIANFILAIGPRLRKEKIAGDAKDAAPVSCDPAFFTGICSFASSAAYKAALETFLGNEAQIADVYIRQIFSVARINSQKYKYVQRGTITIILSLAIELAIIVYLFFYYRVGGKIPTS